MKITAESHTYDGTGRAGFCPVEFRTQARTQAGLLKAWSTAAGIEYARKLKFQEDYDTTALDAQAIEGVWIMEASASIERRPYRMTAYAERGGPVICTAYEMSGQLMEARHMREIVAELREKYATK